MSTFKGVSGRLALVISILVSCVFNVGELASAQETAGSIIGQVTDDSGGVLPGVTVTATSPALQVPEVVVVTNERGEYRMTPLPIGTYEVLYSLSGFQPVKQEAVRLTVGFVAKIDIKLKVGSLTETITVSGTSPVVDVTSTGTRTELTKETLELVPTSRNGLMGLLSQTPGVRTNLDIGGSDLNGVVAFRAYGQSAESWTTMDGINTTSSKDGQSGNFFDYSSYEEARVQAIGNDAEVPVRGVVVTSVLKSGSNQYHGTAFLGQTNHSLEGNNITSALRSAGVVSGEELITRWDRSVELGGKIVENKLWFYGSTRWRKNDTTVLDAFKEDGSPATHNQRQGFHTEKLSYQLSSANRISGFHQWHQKLETRGVTAFVPWESRTLQDTRVNTMGLDWQHSVGSSLVTSLQTGYWEFDSDYLATSELNRPATVDLTTLYRTGPSTTVGNIPLEQKYDTKGSLTWYRPDSFHGNHEIKTGFDYVQNIIKRGWISRGKNLNYMLQFNSGVPTQVQTWNYPIIPESRENYLGLFARDNWTIARRLTLNLGARFAHDRGFVPKQCRQDADPPEFGPATCFDRVEMKAWNTVAPRLYFALDVTGNSKTVVKGGWGRFDSMREVEDVLPFNLNIASNTNWRWHDLNNDHLYQPGEVNLDPNGPDFISRTGQGSDARFANGVLNPDEKEPKTDQFLLSFERELIANFAVRMTGVYARSFNVPVIFNTLRPYEAYNIPITNPDPGKDGLVGTADDPGTFVTYYDYPASLRGLQFQKPTIVNPPGYEQQFKTIEFSADKRLANRWQFMASYSATKTHAPKGSCIDRTCTPNELNPNAEINAANETWEWLGKVSGAYVLPHEITVSANYDHRSGTPLARTVLFRGGVQIPNIVLNVEPLGSFRLPNVNIVDFRAEKSFRLSARQRVSARVNLYNSLNASPVLATTVRSGASFNRPTDIAAPRILEFSGSYSF